MTPPAGNIWDRDIQRQKVAGAGAGGGCFGVQGFLWGGMKMI